MNRRGDERALLDTQTVWLTILGMGVITYLLRLSFIGLSGRLRIPPLVQRGLVFVPPAVFSALVVPDLLQSSSLVPLSLGGDARLIAGVIALLVAWRSKNVVLTIGTGLVVLFVLQTLAGV
ncbi:MAG: AzlD domain-containing protein [Thaumarchaeota archaeon]|nr:AzlD domain-containing protein [Nitrososphaerota archaeon]